MPHPWVRLVRRTAMPPEHRGHDLCPKEAPSNRYVRIDPAARSPDYVSGFCWAIGVAALSQPVTGEDFSIYKDATRSSVRYKGQQIVRFGAARALALGSLLGLAGCAEIGQWFSTPPADTPATEEHLPLPPPPAPPRPAMPKVEPLAPIVIDGLTADAARDLLGAPTSQVAAGPGETWTYKSGPCAVALYLFPDVASGGLRVLDHQIDGAGPRDADQQTCIRRVQHDHAH